MRHLYRMSLQSERTGMTSKNLAIVWSPNILRCDVSELDTQDALQVRRIITINNIATFLYGLAIYHVLFTELFMQ